MIETAGRGAVPFVLRHRLLEDSALLTQESHWDTNFLSGWKLEGEFTPPLKLAVDLDLEGRTLPTLFTSPALVVRRWFAELLQEAGARELEVYAAEIHNEETGEVSHDYVVANIYRRVAAADLEASPGFELGPGIRVVDEPVLRKGAAEQIPIFRLVEDPLQIIVSDQVAARIRAAGLSDVELVAV